MVGCLLGFPPAEVAGQDGLPPEFPLQPLDSSARVEAISPAALFLLLPTGAQGVGLGRAMTALPSGEGAFWNPAGLATLERSHLQLYHGDQVVGDATGVSGMLAASGTGALALSYSLLDLGTDEIRDGDNRPLGETTTRGHQGILSGATELASWLRVGLNVKLIRFSRTCRGECPEGTVRTTGYAFDAGLQLRPLRSQPLDLGVMVAHLGPDIRVDDRGRSEPLPSMVRIGASYQVLRELVDEELGFRILMEVEDRLRDLGSPSFYFGSEFSAGTDDRIYVRGGYVLGNENQLDGPAVGLGLRYERFEFGIARSLARGGPATDGEPVHFTLGVGL